MRIESAVLVLGLAFQGAGAAVVSSGAGGFVVRHEVTIRQPPAAAWRRLTRVADWWSSDHTWSGSAANLSLELKPGGCWCEKLPAGFVRHMEVVFVNAPQMLRLSGGLGPLQGMGASGTLSFVLKPDAAGGTHVLAEYSVAGYLEGGFSEIAAGVDQVLGEQLARYAAP